MKSTKLQKFLYEKTLFLSKDENFVGSYDIDIYDIAGYKMLDTKAAANIYDADISNLPDGIYIVTVTYQGKTNAWKIKYSK